MGDARAVLTKHPLEERASQDPSRPGYHFLPPANWMNDPCGLIQWRGQYHLFYQYNPNGPSHSTIHWGHAVSSDLVHWTHLPIALAPTPGGADEDGCWTGCAVDHDGVPTLFYTGVHPQTVCLATGSNNLVTWQKCEANPVIAAPPPDVRDRAGGHFRDPYLWKDDGWWYLIIGSRVEDAGGMILLYRSPDLVHWEYLHPLMAGDVHGQDPCTAGRMWECPNLFRLGDRHVLLFSIQATAYDHLYPVYHVGTYKHQQFVPETGGILVHGDFYAPQVMHLDDGRRILWGWIEEGRSQRASERVGWAGVMSLPLALKLQLDGRVAVEPVPELQALRGEHWRFDDLELPPLRGGSGTGDGDSSEPRGGVRGDCLEILADFELGKRAEFGLGLRCSPNGQEQTRVVYQAAQGKIIVERDDSSSSPEVERGERTAPVELAASESLKLHIFLDRSVLEILCNAGRTCLATRIYP
ncbi:MAG: glycoside hydrolase family 32 protein, partial [Anaerolineae bacterium]